MVNPVELAGPVEDVVSVGPDVLIEEDAIVVDPVELLGALEETVDEGILGEVLRVEGLLVDPVDDDGG